MKKKHLSPRKIRHFRIKKKVFGTFQRPRVSVFISNKNIYLQLIDDEKGHTLTSCSSKEVKLNNQKNMDTAIKVAHTFGKKILEQKIDKVVFDRSGYLYHGKVAAICEELRKLNIFV
ncbi:50S ribosomal protein L18 [symbiont of Argiope bruennichi]|uniref:50S ribosomal protein L18 n=1 Tax=symbiont of Argiope bruennichi TaxID=2810479 RepID=UPI003DA2FAE3